MQFLNRSNYAFTPHQKAPNSCFLMLPIQEIIRRVSAHLVRRIGAGFTLVEILIYIGIIGAVMVSFMSFILFISHARTTAEVRQEVQSNARIALDFMIQNIHAANQVNAGASVFEAHPGVLALVQGGTNRVFSLDGNGTLTVAENGNLPISITSKKVKVTTLLFTNLSQPGMRGNIRIQLIVENNFGKDISYAYELQSTASLRRQ